MALNRVNVVRAYQHMTLFTSLLLCGVSPQCVAHWYEATTDHFVVYADQPKERVEEFAEQAQRFHNALEARFGLLRLVPSPSNRMQLFVLEADSRLRRVLGERSDSTVYRSRAGERHAFIPHIRKLYGRLSIGRWTFYRDYTRNFIETRLQGPTPAWLRDGAAWFHASAWFEPEGGVVFGTAAEYSGYLYSGRNGVPLENLFDLPGNREQLRRQRYDYLAQSWLLYHYLQLSGEGGQQMLEYRRLLADTDSPIDAASRAFGSLGELRKTLRRFRLRRQFYPVRIAPELIAPPMVRLRTMSPSETALIDERYMLRRGLESADVVELASRLEKAIQLQADDWRAWLILSEARLRSGSWREANDAAAEVLGLRPDEVRALILSGQALVQGAKEESSSALWKLARRQFVRANRLEPNHPLPLLGFYNTYLPDAENIPQLAVDGLYRAFELAPYDEELRLMVARERYRQRDYSEVVATLQPLEEQLYPSTIQEEASALLKAAEQYLDRVEVGNNGQ